MNIINLTHFMFMIFFKILLTWNIEKNSRKASAIKAVMYVKAANVKPIFNVYFLIICE